MTTLTEVRAGAYYDSVVLMQLQRALAGLPDVVDAGVVMATAANKEVLQASDLLTDEVKAAKNDDLVIVVKASSEAAAQAALDQVDALAKQKSSSGGTGAFRPKSLKSAAKMMPQADWVLVSVNGRYAVDVVDEALDLGKHVFLYSDNVSIEDESRLKQKAKEKNLLVMGPDCGTAIVNGVGLGFANRVRRGTIGLVAASGTGLQLATVEIHNAGGGVSQAIGTGGRDLKDAVGGITALQALEMLKADDDTSVIVLISKPPSSVVANKLLSAAYASEKPVVVNFLGYASGASQFKNVHFAQSLTEAATLATSLLEDGVVPAEEWAELPKAQGYLRGLFSGGTLAYEVVLALRALVSPLFSNLSAENIQSLKNPLQSEGHTLIDLGEDEFTQGRLHPMMDNDLRIRRLQDEAADPETGLIVLDVVLGEGAHANPASELCPAIAQIKQQRPELIVYAIVIGTDDDPQDKEQQIAQFEAAGALVATALDEAVDEIAYMLTATAAQSEPAPKLAKTFAGINVGLETFYDSILAQGAEAIQVDWKPPASGNEKMMALLARLKQK